MAGEEYRHLYVPACNWGTRETICIPTERASRRIRSVSIRLRSEILDMYQVEPAGNA